MGNKLKVLAAALAAVPALTFAGGAGATTATPTSEQSSYGWVDFTGDGRADRCALRSDNRLYCTPSTGTGFAPPIASGTVDPGYGAGRAWADFNGDGRVDYCRVVGDFHKMVSCTVSGGGSFGPTYTSGSLDAGYDAGRAWVDVNADRRADYCRVVGGWAKQVECTLSTGTGFGSTIRSGDLDPGYDAGRAWADANGDSRADYCRVVGAWSNQIQCTLSTGSGFGSTFTSAGLDAGYDASRTWTDINADRRADYCRIVGPYGGNRVSCTPSLGTTFGSTFTSVTLDLGTSAARRWADIDRDGRADFCREASGPSLLCTRSTGSGFDGYTVRYQFGSGDQGGYATRLADFNADGRADYCRQTFTSRLACTASAGSSFGQSYFGQLW